MHFFYCEIHTAPWYLPLRFGRVAEVSPLLDFAGIPPGITNIFKNRNSVNSYWFRKIMTIIYNFTKIATILTFHVNMPQS